MRGWAPWGAMAAAAATAAAGTDARAAAATRRQGPEPPRLTIWARRLAETAGTLGGDAPHAAGGLGVEGRWTLER